MSTSKCWSVRWFNSPDVHSLRASDFGGSFDRLRSVLCLDPAPHMWIIIRYCRSMKESAVRDTFKCELDTMLRVKVVLCSFADAVDDMACCSDRLQLPFYHLANGSQPVPPFAVEPGRAVVRVDPSSIDYNYRSGYNKYLSTYEILSEIRDMRKRDRFSKVRKTFNNSVKESEDVIVRTRPEVWYIYGEDLQKVKDYCIASFGSKLFSLGLDELDSYVNQDVCLFEFDLESSYIKLFDLYNLFKKYTSRIEINGKKYEFTFNRVLVVCYAPFEIAHTVYCYRFADTFKFKPLALLVDHNVEFNTSDMTFVNKGPMSLV